MSTTPPQKIPGIPPGEPREAFLKYLAGRYPGVRSGFDKSEPWSAERDKEDADDDDEGSAPPQRKRDRPARQESAPAQDSAWSFKKPTTCAKAEWIVTTFRRWENDPRCDDPDWVVTNLSASKVLVIRVSPA
jgi:hypothetical protein